MDKLRDSLNYLFKERDWVLKLLLPIVLLFILTIPSILLTTITGSSSTQSPVTIDNYFDSYNSYSYNYSRQMNFADTLGILVGCLSIFFIIPMFLIQFWYMYENTQSGIFVRKTNAIWKNKFEDTLKKVAKYFVLNLVYGIVFLLISGVIFGLGLCVILLFLALFTSGNYNFEFNSASALLGSGLVLFMLCIGSIVFFVLLGFFYIIYTPAVLRLVATNTLSEGFKFRENWEIGKRHAGEILGIYLVSILGGGLVGMLSGLISFGSMMFLTMPGIYLVITLVSNYFVLVISTFFGYFFIPRYMGLVYRDIINKEESLKFIKLD